MHPTSCQPFHVPELFIRRIQAGGNAKSTAGSIKENVGGLVSDQWAAEGTFRTRSGWPLTVSQSVCHSRLLHAGKQQRTEGDAEVEAAKVCTAHSYIVSLSDSLHNMAFACTDQGVR